MPDISAAFDFGDAAAWALIVATLVFHFEVHRTVVGGAVALAVLAGLIVKAVLVPLT